MPKLRLVTILVAAFACYTCGATQQADRAAGAPAFAIGDPIRIVLRYDGGIDGWDGAILAGERNGEPHMIISNGAGFVLTRGSGEFVPEKPDSLGGLPHWQTFEGRHGRLVQQIGTRVERCSYMIAVARPFRTVVDLTQFYKIDTPGTYWVYWSMWDVWDDEFSFEVLEAAAPDGPKRD